MDLAAAVGAERLREIMTELLDRSVAVVQHYGGTVDKFTGDGIMAVFGAPAALEDHAFRACLTALDIQSTVAELAQEVEARDGIDLRLRVGLNSGQVIAGEIGSGPLGYTAVGEQVGMAQRDGVGGAAGWGDAQRVQPIWAVRRRGPRCGPRYPMPTVKIWCCLMDLLGIRDPDVALPDIAADARRRRLTALIDTASLATARLVEDAAVLGEPETVHIKGGHAPVCWPISWR
jgi:hypothetical protein